MQPPEDVHAAVAARHAGVPPDGDEHDGGRSGQARRRSGRRCDEAPTTRTPPAAAARRVAVGRGRRRRGGRATGSGAGARDDRAPPGPVATTTLPGQPGAGVGLSRGTGGARCRPAVDARARRCWGSTGAWTEAAYAVEPLGEAGATRGSASGSVLAGHPRQLGHPGGLRSVRESQRSRRQRCAMSPRSSTTWSRPASRKRLAGGEAGMPGTDDDGVDRSILVWVCVLRGDWVPVRPDVPRRPAGAPAAVRVQRVATSITTEVPLVRTS